MTIPVSGLSRTYHKKRDKSPKQPKTRRIRAQPLVPQLMGSFRDKNGNSEIFTAEGPIQVDNLRTTQRLSDELFYRLLDIEAEPEFTTIPVSNNGNVTYESQRFEKSNTFLYRKYLIRAETLAGSYCSDHPTIFIINLCDLTRQLQAELMDLQSAKSRSTLQLVLHLAVERIFALASLAWFFESADQEIKVEIRP